MTKENFAELMNRASVALLEDFDRKGAETEKRTQAAFGKIDSVVVEAVEKIDNAVAGVKAQAEKKLKEIDSAIEDRFKSRDQVIASVKKNIANVDAGLAKKNKELEEKISLQATAIEVLKARLSSIESKAIQAGKALLEQKKG